MRWNLINMLRQARECIENSDHDTGGYAYGLECLEENLAAVRDGRDTWADFAEFYCLTERDRKPDPSSRPQPQADANGPTSRSEPSSPDMPTSGEESCSATGSPASIPEGVRL